MPASKAKITVALVGAVAALVGLAFGARALWDVTSGGITGNSCTVGSFEVDTDQAAIASAMVGAVTKYRVELPERATVLVLAAALQESKLRNVPPGAGDRDSVGVLQQRPSQGWGDGDANKLLDVQEATKEFLDALLKVPNWQELPLAEAVQDVQISADGSLYAQHEPEAQALADALLGVKPAAISCSFDKPTKVAPPTKVATLAAQQLGIDTPRPVGGGVQVPGAHWQTVAWFVANADRLGIDQVAYAGKRWSRADGWQTYTPASTGAVTATMAKL